METLTIQQQHKRKALLVAPLVVFVLTTLLFCVLGGGQTGTGSDHRSVLTGFNSHLPEAKVKEDTGQNKLSFYNRAAADSAKLMQEQQTDPYARYHALAAGKDIDTGAVFSPHQPEVFSNKAIEEANRPEDKAILLNKRLVALQAAINSPAAIPDNYSSIPSTANLKVKRISNSSQPISAAQDDPELKQMNGLLEKLLDLQHPDRVTQKTAKSDIASAEQFKAIPAVVDGNQKIVQGTVIRMRLQDSVRLNGQLFLKGQLIYGSGDFYNQRVKVNIKLIHIGLNIIPVDLTVYDRTDGLEGICVPEAVTNEALKDGMLNGMQTVDMMNMDPSMTAQLATAGINTAKGLFSKKVKQVKGKLKNGHELLLRNNVLVNAGNQSK
ncbi:conjugative transposon protein TraM [Mucilaginibacter achroorhodeus]|uniref:Conjugative transposon protein TraM n=1 Tax=Mucilaginibacter achroorhodeus TaxID=2599294 RepID=A0A563U692_9SPHI|nr:conjugative transposon protein TraM [Mucilaginibacter achroorhodeus]TWR26829.1 conjugative transposon protein TraM [Mucilaginibacter achroorhodeus]